MSKRVRVGLIDDNEITRAALRLMLNADEFDVVMEAATSRAGLELALRTRPEIICLDIVLPDGNGLEVLKTLRATLPSASVVMVTARNDAETIKEAIAAGATGFVIKPFTSQTILDALVKIKKGAIDLRPS